MCFEHRNKMKHKNTTLSKPFQNRRNKGELGTTNTQIHDRSLSP
jgi:hypothetical protein